MQTSAVLPRALALLSALLGTLALAPAARAEEADLGVAVSASAGEVVLAGHVTYTATVSNAGPSWQGEVLFGASRSARLMAISASTGQGSCSVADGRVDCELGRMEAGSQVTVTFVARADSPGPATRAVSAYGTSYGIDDPDEADNIAWNTTTVLAPPSALPPAPVVWRAPVTSAPTPPATTRHDATSASVRRSGRRITGRIRSSPVCLGGRRVVLRRKGSATTRYGAAVTRADGTFTITTRRRLRGRVYVVVGKSFSSSGICSAGRSPAR